uniref:Uncharacterized protein n=1 Tax=Chromera velia CCMP2878 TaxID=1169474 RepID=A0A0G4HZT5_9ALVE|eukprot:Cvel_9803.t1-p1 / transcript=Cvel_9803.t1 / gene=Cvel_9803 / organism=Chromera_velia_CCMP2878 / gene_product=hypothetical protein / transcript_product=hypothetical protein / location=Cvel_scaffold575:41652-48700(-) / protein_length=2064 / sequence_SO=supercontig / SO=protein_coding / is_pseudo=false
MITIADSIPLSLNVTLAQALHGGAAFSGETGYRGKEKSEEQGRNGENQRIVQRNCNLGTGNQDEEGNSVKSPVGGAGTSENARVFRPLSRSRTLPDLRAPPEPEPSSIPAALQVCPRDFFLHYRLPLPLRPREGGTGNPQRHLLLSDKENRGENLPCRAVPAARQCSGGGQRRKETSACRPALVLADGAEGGGEERETPRQHERLAEDQTEETPLDRPGKAKGKERDYPSASKDRTCRVSPRRPISPSLYQGGKAGRRREIHGTVVEGEGRAEKNREGQTASPPSLPHYPAWLSARGPRRSPPKAAQRAPESRERKAKAGSLPSSPRRPRTANSAFSKGPDCPPWLPSQPHLLLEEPIRTSKKQQQLAVPISVYGSPNSGGGIVPQKEARESQMSVIAESFASRVESATEEGKRGRDRWVSARRDEKDRESAPVSPPRSPLPPSPRLSSKGGSPSLLSPKRAGKLPARRGRGGQTSPRRKYNKKGEKTLSPAPNIPPRDSQAVENDSPPAYPPSFSPNPSSCGGLTCSVGSRRSPLIPDAAHMHPQRLSPPPADPPPPPKSPRERLCGLCHRNSTGAPACPPTAVPHGYARVTMKVGPQTPSPLRSFSIPVTPPRQTPGTSFADGAMRRSVSCPLEAHEGGGTQERSMGGQREGLSPLQRFRMSSVCEISRQLQNKAREFILQSRERARERSQAQKEGDPGAFPSQRLPRGGGDLALLMRPKSSPHIMDRGAVATREWERRKTPTPFRRSWEEIAADREGRTPPLLPSPQSSPRDSPFAPPSDLFRSPSHREIQQDHPVTERDATPISEDRCVAYRAAAALSKSVVALAEPDRLGTPTPIMVEASTSADPPPSRRPTPPLSAAPWHGSPTGNFGRGMGMKAGEGKKRESPEAKGKKPTASESDPEVKACRADLTERTFGRGVGCGQRGLEEGNSGECVATAAQTALSFPPPSRLNGQGREEVTAEELEGAVLWQGAGELQDATGVATRNRCDNRGDSSDSPGDSQKASQLPTGCRQKKRKGSKRDLSPHGGESKKSLSPNHRKESPSPRSDLSASRSISRSRTLKNLELAEKEENQHSKHHPEGTHPTPPSNTHMNSAQAAAEGGGGGGFPTEVITPRSVSDRIRKRLAALAAAAKRSSRGEREKMRHTVALLSGHATCSRSPRENRKEPQPPSKLPPDTHTHPKSPKNAKVTQTPISPPPPPPSDTRQAGSMIHFGAFGALVQSQAAAAAKAKARRSAGRVTGAATTRPPRKLPRPSTPTFPLPLSDRGARRTAEHFEEQTALRANVPSATPISVLSQIAAHGSSPDPRKIEFENQKPPVLNMSDLPRVTPASPLPTTERRRRTETAGGAHTPAVVTFRPDHAKGPNEDTERGHQQKKEESVQKKKQDSITRPSWGPLPYRFKAPAPRRGGESAPRFPNPARPRHRADRDGYSALKPRDPSITEAVGPGPVPLAQSLSERGPREREREDLSFGSSSERRAKDLREEENPSGDSTRVSAPRQIHIYIRSPSPAVPLPLPSSSLADSPPFECLPLLPPAKRDTNKQEETTVYQDIPRAPFSQPCSVQLPDSQTIQADHPGCATLSKKSSFVYYSGNLHPEGRSEEEEKSQTDSRKASSAADRAPVAPINATPMPSGESSSSAFHEMQRGGAYRGSVTRLRRGVQSARCLATSECFPGGGSWPDSLQSRLTDERGSSIIEGDPFTFNLPQGRGDRTDGEVPVVQGRRMSGSGGVSLTAEKFKGQRRASDRVPSPSSVTALSPCRPMRPEEFARLKALRKAQVCKERDAQKPKAKKTKEAKTDARTGETTFPYGFPLTPASIRAGSQTCRNRMMRPMTSPPKASSLHDARRHPNSKRGSSSSGSRVRGGRCTTGPSLCGLERLAVPISQSPSDSEVAALLEVMARRAAEKEGGKLGGAVRGASSPPSSGLQSRQGGTNRQRPTTGTALQGERGNAGNGHGTPHITGARLVCTPEDISVSVVAQMAVKQRKAVAGVSLSRSDSARRVAASAAIGVRQAPLSAGFEDSRGERSAVDADRGEIPGPVFPGGGDEEFKDLLAFWTPGVRSR